METNLPSAVFNECIALHASTEAWSGYLRISKRLFLSGSFNLKWS